MQYQQTPQGLETMFGSNVANGGGSIAATPSMMQLLSQQQGADQLVTQDNQRQFNYDTLNDPLKLQGKDLDNQTLEAHLPGIQARGRMDTRKDANEALLNDKEIADHIGRYGAAESERHVKDMENLGQLALQHSEATWASPLGAAARAKAAFVAAGHGDMWNPDWDKMNAGDLAEKLGIFGKKIQETNSGFNKALTMANTKGAIAEAVAGTNKDARTESAQIAANARVAAAGLVAKARQAASGDKKSLEQLATALIQKAQIETDPETKKHYETQAQEVLAEANKLKASSTQVRVDAEPSIDALAKGKLESNKTNAATGHDLSKFPSGSKVNANGDVEAPDGTVYRKKK